MAQVIHLRKIFGLNYEEHNKLRFTSLGFMKRLIRKLFEGTCSREELLSLLEMLREKDVQPAPEVMERLWEELQKYEKLPPSTSEKIFAKTLRKIENRGSKQKTLYRYWIGAAASVILLIGLLLWLPWDAENTVEMTTSFAEQKQLELPDGSLVTLNANSSITYASAWNDKEPRRVWLQGEAFFDVAKKETTKQKFEVRTQDLVVEVLGTSFNVNTHHAQTRVFLEEGIIKLKLDNRAEPLLLEPGDLVSYSQKTQKTNREKVKQQAPSSWKEGIVIFKDAPLETILKRINEIYGLDYAAPEEDQLERVFTISIPVDNFETMRGVLEVALGRKVTIENNKLIIK